MIYRKHDIYRKLCYDTNNIFGVHKIEAKIDGFFFFSIKGNQVGRETFFQELYYKNRSSVRWR